MVVDVIVAGYFQSKKPDVYKILDENFGGEFFGVGLRKNDLDLLGELQKTLDEMKADGTSAKISETWFGKNIVE